MLVFMHVSMYVCAYNIDLVLSHAPRLSAMKWAGLHLPLVRVDNGRIILLFPTVSQQCCVVVAGVLQLRISTGVVGVVSCRSWCFAVAGGIA